MPDPAPDPDPKPVPLPIPAPNPIDMLPPGAEGGPPESPGVTGAERTVKCSMFRV